MLTIYRYPINETVNSVHMPTGARVLNVGTAIDPETGKEVISLWASVDTDNSKEFRQFVVAGTGADLSSLTTYLLKYVGTTQRHNKYAFHVFEIVK